MDKIFEIATNISTPLALAGLCATILFFIILQILKKDIFPRLTRILSSRIIVLIINRLFTLSLVAMILGFIGFLTTSFRKTDKKPLSIEGTVLLNNNALKNVDVRILEVEKSDVTNDFGRFKIEFYKKEATERYTIRFSNPFIKDTTQILENDQLSSPLTLNLTSITPSPDPNSESKILHLGQEWTDNNSRAYVKFEEIKDNEICIGADLEWNDTDFLIYCFTPTEGFNKVFNTNSKRYVLHATNYNNIDKTIDISVLPVEE